MIKSQTSHLRTVVVLAALVSIIVGLHLASRLGLRGPTELNRAGVADWIEDPVAALATVARWVSLVLAYYLTVVVSVSAILGERMTESTWQRVTPSAISSLVGLLLGTAAVVVPLAATATDQPKEQPPETPILRVVDDHLTLVDVSQTALDAPDTANSADSLILAADDLWTVRNGDSFWSIAEETLAEELSRTDLTEVEIADYWRTLIAANEDELIEPGNPDLIFPGQVLTLPPTSSIPSP